MLNFLKSLFGGKSASKSANPAAGLNDLEDFVDYVVKSLVDYPDEVEIASVETKEGATIQIRCRKEDLGKIVKSVNKGMTSRVGNMFFQQYGLDEDRADRVERLDKVGNFINDDYQEMK